MRVLYDGWSLVHAPLSPEALHLWAILRHLPEEVTSIVAFPQPTPDWTANLDVHLHPVPDTPYGRLRWEQNYLPRLAREEEIDVLHLTTPTAPVLSDLNVILSPAVFGSGSGIDKGSSQSLHLFDRLRRSLAHGGMVRVKETLWPVDLPDPHLPGRLSRLSTVLPPGFGFEIRQAADDSLFEDLEDLNLPDEFIIYHGPGDLGSLERMLQAWTWAAAAIGESHPLLLLGLDSGIMTQLSALGKDYDLGSSLYFMGQVTPDLLPEIYRRCNAVFHPAPASPWSGPVRLALASGKPLVASESNITDAITGPAAYLAPHGDSRALGAALVTVIVEEQIADKLSAAAKRRAENWETDKYPSQLWRIYTRVSKK